MKTRIFVKIIVISVLFVVKIQAQSTSVNIVDSRGNPVGLASIKLESKICCVTNLDGFVKLENINSEGVNITVEAMGYELYKQLIYPNKTYNIIVKDDIENLKELQLYGNTKEEVIEKQPFEVDVVIIDEQKNSSADVSHVLEKMPGVNIRRTGGLGSSFNFSLNGVSGKRVRFFIDGIPLETSGSSLTIDNFPATLVDRVEVYKGVVPIFLGADALGGAINLVTKQVSKEDYLDVSYGYGSFNTHRATVNFQKNLGKDWIVKLGSFYNYSDNNYKIDDVDVVDNLGNVIGTVDDVERFHDAYQSTMVELKTGVINKPYADELLVGATLSGSNNELQHSAVTAQDPLGEVLEISKTYRTFLSYKKKDLLNKKIELII